MRDVEKPDVASILETLTLESSLLIRGASLMISEDLGTHALIEALIPTYGWLASFNG